MITEKDNWMSQPNKNDKENIATFTLLKPSLFILEDKTYNLFVWFMLGTQSHRIKENFTKI